MEDLLHFSWKNRIYLHSQLSTTYGQPLEILDPGLHNVQSSGPDFLQAKIKIGDVVWVGNVELHTRASEWYAHKHQLNPAYDTVILHVVLHADREVFNSKGEPITQMELSLPKNFLQLYNELRATDSLPRCYKVIPKLPKLVLHGWLNVLLCERFEHRTTQIEERLKRLEGNWSDCFFATIARNFGFGINGDTFEQWILKVPLRAVDKHRDNLMQIEALFFGQAGLLEIESIPERHKKKALEDGYFSMLRKEYLFLAHKFALHPMDFHLWKFLRTRPANFPHIRIAQLARLYYEQKVNLSTVMEMENMKQLRELFNVGTSEYWNNHYLFGADCEKQLKSVQLKSLQLIAINSIAPFMFAYGKYKLNEAYKERAIKIIESLPAENNYIIRMWKESGYSATNAADTQALIELKNIYCDKKECLRCRIGYYFLTH